MQHRALLPLASSKWSCLFIGELFYLEVEGGVSVRQLKLVILLIQRDSEEQNLEQELENKPKSME